MSPHAGLDVVVVSTRGMAEANAVLAGLTEALAQTVTHRVDVLLVGAAYDGAVDLILDDPATDALRVRAIGDLAGAIASVLAAGESPWALIVSDDVRVSGPWFDLLAKAASEAGPELLSPTVRFGDRAGVSAAPESGSGVALLLARGRDDEAAPGPARHVEDAVVELVAPNPHTKRARGAAAHRAWVEHVRRARLRPWLDRMTGRGLEIGPLDSGIADAATMDVRYVDVFDRAGVVDHYHNDTNVILEMIPEIHYPLYGGDGAVRTLQEAAAPGAPFEWFIASHVIEHVPDVIGWLAQLAALAADGARLLLVVPDRRYTFDRHRPPTTTGQALQAYDEGHVVPSVRAVYDHYSTVVAADAAALWSGERPVGRDVTTRIDTAMKQVERARRGEYVDVHVWLYTPQSLLAQVKELRALGLCDWSVEELVDTQPGELEFFALLRRLPRDGSGEVPGEVPGEPALRSDLPDWLEDEVELRRAVRVLARASQERRSSDD